MTNQTQDNGRDQRGWFKKGNKCWTKQRRHKPKDYKKDLPKVVEMFIASAHNGGQEFVDSLRKDDAAKFVTALCTLSRFAESDPQGLKTPKCPVCEFDPKVQTIDQALKIGNDAIRQMEVEKWEFGEHITAMTESVVGELEKKVKSLTEKLDIARRSAGESVVSDQSNKLNPAEQSKRDAAIDARRREIFEQRMADCDDPDIWK